jgi:hypothetical protein
MSGIGRFCCKVGDQRSEAADAIFKPDIAVCSIGSGGF